MKIIYSNKGSECPFKEPPPMARANKDTFSEDWWGAFSIEKFCDQSPLSYTHEDAQGWLEYLTKFHPANFWFQDGGVQPWAYYEDYDNWQDTYGIDAVMAVYHSGHGGMDGSGKFYLPMGAKWGNEGCTVVSDRMRLGNEQVNYVFFSTCESLRVLGGHNPIRTWQSANLGFRMLFGYETVSWDNPNYGKFFWQKWNSGQSLSTAWLEASWQIAHDQAPSVVACGATADEAKNRVFNERFLSWDHVSNNYWWWRWYNVAKTANAMRQPNLMLPKNLLTAELRPLEVSEQGIRNLIERYGVEMRLPGEVLASPEGHFSLTEGDLRVSFGANGSYEVQKAKPNLFNLNQISVDRAKSIAQETIRNYGLDQEVDLIFDAVRLELEAGGSKEGNGSISGPFVTQTTVQFRQAINGVPVVTPAAGTVRVSIDNDGTVTRIHSATRPIERLSDRPQNTVAAPTVAGAIAQPRINDAAGYESLLQQEWSQRMASWAVRGSLPVQYNPVPGSTEIGYDIRGNNAILVAQRAVEVDFGNGYRKRYWVVTPILE